MTGRPPRRVLEPARAVAGQSLIGLVRECAWNNRLPSIGVLLRDAVPTAHAWGDLAFRSDVDEAGLARSMRIPSEEVASRMHAPRRIAGDLLVRSFFGAEVRAHHFQKSRRAFSPGALQIAPHHRAMWQMALLPFCLESGETLVDRCARCGRRLEWAAAKPLTRCSHCDRPAAADPRPVPNAVRRAGTLLFGPLDPRPGEREAATARLHPDLQALPPGAATDLGWSLGRLACDLGAAPHSHDGLLPAASRIEVILAAADVLAGWPDSVPALMRSALARDQERARLMRAGLKRLCGHRAGWPEQQHLLTTRFPSLTGTTRQAFSTAHGGTVTAAEALPILRMTWNVLPRLVRAGALEVVGARHGRRMSGLFDAASVHALAGLRGDCASLGHASERLGISHDGVGQLVGDGLLQEHRGPAVEAMYDQRQVSVRSLDGLLARLDRGAVRDGTDGAPDARLLRASCGVGGGTKPWAAIFGALLEGALPYHLLEEGSGGAAAAGRTRGLGLVERILVDPDDFARCRFTAADDGTGPGARARDISRRDAAEILNLTPSNLIRALGSELRQAALPNGLLLRAAVLDLARTRIAPAEIAVRFASGGRRLPEGIRAAGLPKLGASGWARDAVEAACKGRQRL